MTDRISRSSFTRASGLRQAAVLLCALFVGSGALEFHNLASHHSAIEVGGLFAPAAAHPRIPRHFDRSEEMREPACATCALQAQLRGVRPEPTRPVAAPRVLRFELLARAERAPSALPSSASPRGPPAA